MKLGELATSMLIDPNKLIDYALNPNHPEGKHKARVFETALGYTFTMIKPELFDIVEILYPLPEENLPSGARGTLIHHHGNDTYEVEFVDEHGITIALCDLSRQQYIVIWRSETKEWVPLANQVAQMVNLLPEQAGREVMDIAHFLSMRQAQQQDYPQAMVN